MDVLGGLRKELTSLKVGDLVQDVFTKEVGIVIEIYDLEQGEELYVVYIQNPRDKTSPTTTYSKRSLWVLIDLLQERMENDF
jgi:hypothetical protein